MPSRFTLFAACALSALLCAIPPSICAQPGAPRVAVTVALVDELPAPGTGYDALVVREPGGSDLILLPRASATGALLDAATRTLLHARATARAGGATGHTSTVALGVNSTPPPAGWARRYLAGAQRVVERLRFAEPRLVEGVGTVPAVRFFPPPLPRR